MARGEVTVCLVGTLLYSARPKSTTDASAGKGDFTGRPSASSIASAVLLSSSAPLNAPLPSPRATMVKDLQSDRSRHEVLNAGGLDNGGGKAEGAGEKDTETKGESLAGDHYMLVDASSVIYRAFYGIKYMKNGTDG